MNMVFTLVLLKLLNNNIVNEFYIIVKNISHFVKNIRNKYHKQIFKFLPSLI